MEFLIYEKLDWSEWKATFDQSARDQGTKGRVTTARPPIDRTSTLEEAVERAYAQVGRHPSDSLFVTDSEGNLLEIALNLESYRLRELLRYWRFQAAIMFVFGIFSLAVTARHDLQWTGSLIFLGISGLELAVSRFFNFVEGAIVFLILMTLASLFFDQRPGPQKSQQPRPATMPVPSQAELQ